MSIEFNCSNCQKILRVAEEFAGRKARCPSCQTVNAVVGSSESAISQSPDNQTPVGEPPKSAPGNPFKSQLDDSAGYQQRASPHLEPHRGVLVLVLGILSLVCNVCMVPGILALVFGLADLKKIKQGRMDPEGNGMTLAGTILGGIATALVAIVLIFYLCIFVIAVATGI